MGIKIKLSMMKVLMHMQMRWCMHIEDGDHDDQYDAQINCGCKKASNHDHEHHRPELKAKKSRSRSRSRSRSKSRSASAASSSSSSSSSSASASNMVKVVKWEGGVKRYTGPTKVGEVTMEFPKHMVCRSDSLYIGQKIPSLSDHSLLQPGHTYFLLPSHLFNSALSFVTVASILSSKNSMLLRNRNRNTITTRKLGLGTAPAASCPMPFLVQKSPSGCSRMRVSDEFIIAHLIYNNHDDDDDDDDEEEQVVVLDDDSCPHTMKNRKSGLCTTPQLQKAYAQLVPSRPQWKPNLPTITEITSTTGKTTTSSRRRRKKKKNKQQQQQQQQLNSSSLPLMPSNNIIMTKAHTSRKIKIFKSRSSKSSSSSSSHSPSN